MPELSGGVSGKGGSIIVPRVPLFVVVKSRLRYLIRTAVLIVLLVPIHKAISYNKIWLLSISYGSTIHLAFLIPADIYGSGIL